MIICPYCDAENIEGADACDQCGQSISDLHLPSPASDIERCLLRDRLSVLQPIRQVAQVAPQTTVREVLKLLADRSIGCVLVTQDERMVGIFSERDALIKINTKAAELGDRPVSDYMTTNPQSLDSEAKIAFAVHRMSVGGYRHVPITDERQRPVSIISVRDVLRYLTERMASDTANGEAAG